MNSLLCDRSHAVLCRAKDTTRRAALHCTALHCTMWSEKMRAAFLACVHSRKDAAAFMRDADPVVSIVNVREDFLKQTKSMARHESFIMLALCQIHAAAGNFDFQVTDKEGVVYTMPEHIRTNVLNGPAWKAATLIPANTSITARTA